MEIRYAKENDADRISYLIRKNIDANPNNYSKKQISTWKKHNTPAKIKQQLTHKKIFCAFKNGKLLGTIALEEDYISGFYVSFFIRGQGVGSKLLTHLEGYAKTKKINKLYLISTPSAVGFYQKKGFVPTKEIITTIDNVDYAEVEMEKVL